MRTSFGLPRRAIAISFARSSPVFALVERRTVEVGFEVSTFVRISSPFSEYKISRFTMFSRIAVWGRHPVSIMLGYGCVGYSHNNLSVQRNKNVNR